MTGLVIQTRPTERGKFTRNRIAAPAARIISVGKGTKLVPPLHIEAGVVIGAGCVIGPNVYIERDCHIGDGATLQESVLLRGAILPAGVQVEGRVVS